MEYCDFFLFQCGSNPGTLRRRGGPIAASEARKKQRPRSANISPQRLLSHSIMPQMEGALIVGGGGEPSESAHQKQGQPRGKGSKTKPRTGSVSPSATIGR